MEETGLRAILRRQKTVGTMVVVGLLGLSAFLLWGAGSSAGEGQPGFYSNDDGRSFFTGAEPFPPFTRGGREAVAAYVFSCDGGAVRTARYLTKYTPVGKLAAEKAAARAREIHQPPAKGEPKGLLIKRPGDATWLANDDPANAGKIREIRDVKCPDGSAATQYFAE